jgi:two-component system OmpR family response regulator
MSRILIVEDEPAIAFTLENDLEAEGYEIAVVADGVEAVKRALSEPFDLILLDVMLPNKDGFEVCRELRRGGLSTRIIMLTAKTQEAEKILGLDMGADDYVTKPFSLNELLGRIRAVLKRTRPDAPGSRLRVADLELDEDAHEVRRAGALVALTPTEYRLLRFLMVNAGRVVSKDQILNEVWEYDPARDGNVVEPCVSYLRRKVDQGQPRLIHTVRGFGYVLRIPPS